MIFFWNSKRVENAFFQLFAAYLWYFPKNKKTNNTSTTWLYRRCPIHFLTQDIASYRCQHSFISSHYTQQIKNWKMWKYIFDQMRTRQNGKLVFQVLLVCKLKWGVYTALLWHSAQFCTSKCPQFWTARIWTCFCVTGRVFTSPFLDGSKSSNAFWLLKWLGYGFKSTVSKHVIPHRIVSESSEVCLWSMSESKL